MRIAIVYSLHKHLINRHLQCENALTGGDRKLEMMRIRYYQPAISIAGKSNIFVSNGFNRFLCLSKT